MRRQLLGPAGLALAAVLVLCVVAPPEVRGAALAALALFIAALSAAAFRPTASVWVFASVPLALVAMRTAIAPGEAVEPVVCLFLAALAGVGAASVSGRAETLAPLFAALLTFASGRALYETFWGLSALAARLRDAAPAGEGLAILNRLEQGRPYGGFSTPAALGCFLILALPPVVAWALGRSGAARAFGLGAAALGVSGLIATRSLSAMAALACAVALAGLRGRVAPRFVALTAGILGLAIVAVALVRPDAAFAPAREDSPWRLRAGNVRVALEMTRDHPLAGVGPGGFAEAFPQYRSEGDNESRHAHNLPAELLAEWGVPVGAVLSAVFFWVFLRPVVRGAQSPRTLGFGLTVGLAAFAIHNLADFTAFLPSLLVFAAACRGLLVEDPLGGFSGARGILAARVAWVALVLAVALTAAGSGLARETLFDAREAAAQGDHAGALRFAERAARLAPWDADPPQFAAEARMAAGVEAGAALADAERAVRRAPSRASARMVRARARAAEGELGGAYADAAEAQRLYPLHPDYAAQRDAIGSALFGRGEAAAR